MHNTGVDSAVTALVGVGDHVVAGHADGTLTRVDPRNAPDSSTRLRSESTGRIRDVATVGSSLALLHENGSLAFLSTARTQRVDACDDQRGSARTRVRTMITIDQLAVLGCDDGTLVLADATGPETTTTTLVTRSPRAINEILAVDRRFVLRHDNGKVEVVDGGLRASDGLRHSAKPDAALVAVGHGVAACQNDGTISFTDLRTDATPSQTVIKHTDKLNGYTTLVAIGEHLAARDHGGVVTLLKWALSDAEEKFLGASSSNLLAIGDRLIFGGRTGDITVVDVRSSEPGSTGRLR